MVDLKTKCLIDAGLRKPKKADIMQTIDEVVESGEISDATRKLVGQILRLYQKWPAARATESDLDWCQQILVPDSDGVKDRVHAGGRRHVAYDGYRVHIASSRYWFGDKMGLLPFNLDSIWEDGKFEYPVTVGLDSFENVDPDLVWYRDRTYLEQYILEAFAGSDLMRTTQAQGEHLHLQSMDERRVAVIAPLRS